MPGPYYFCYLDGPADFDPEVHLVEDEAIILAKIAQEEGEFATLEIDVINTGDGLLAPGRKQWCIFSWDRGGSGDDIEVLFMGRLVAVPQQVRGETMRLLFRAKPLDYDGAKQDLAETLKTWPYYDLVWITADADDPDVIIKAYGASYHIDRVTHEITISDHLVGDDTIILGEDEHIYDSLSISYAQKPKERWKFRGELGWTQGGSGTIDLTSLIVDKFRDQASIYGAPTSTGIICTLTGDGLKSDWPTGGTSLGGGWEVNRDTFIRDANSKVFAPYEVTVTFQGLVPGSTPGTNVAQNFLGAWTDWTAKFTVYALQQNTLFDWVANRPRKEILEFEMVADIQPIVDDDFDYGDVTISVTITAQDTVTEPDDLGATPIGDNRRNAYLTTDRGAYSAQYPMLLGRAELRLASRAVEIGGRVPWETAIELTLKKNLLVVDHRIPGGSAAGKVTSYAIQASGTGENWGDFTIGCAVGRGGSVTAAVGTGSVFVDGLVEDLIQELIDSQITAPTEDIVYQPLYEFTIDDDGVDLTTLDETTAVESLELTGGLKTQVQVVLEAPQPIDALPFYKSRMTLQVVPVAGMSFETVFTPTIEPLPIPKLIDLEASA